LCDVGLEESSAPTSRRKSVYIEELQKLATAERLANRRATHKERTLVNGHEMVSALRCEVLRNSKNFTGLIPYDLSDRVGRARI